jgi:hypothetical protein
VPRYVVKVRSGSRVERERFDDLGSAIGALEERGQDLERSADGRPIDLKVRRFEPVQRVVARLELAGPRRLRAGVDVRGDGSAEAYIGRVRRRLVEQRSDESPYDALRRAIGGVS